MGGRRKKEEGRRKKEEGRRKKEEGRGEKEKDCDDFMRVIREHEAITQSRGYKEQGRKVKIVKKDEETKTDFERPAHVLCGVKHGKGQCKYKCQGCGKPHREDQCYLLTS